MPNKEDVKVGDEVCVNAPWSRISGGVVTDVAFDGFEVSGMWFGWHELESVKPRAEVVILDEAIRMTDSEREVDGSCLAGRPPGAKETREELYRRLLVRALPFIEPMGCDLEASGLAAEIHRALLGGPK